MGCGMTGQVTECGLCAGRNLELVLSLGSSPVTCDMAGAGQEWFPLELLECQDCSLVQLSYIVDRERVFAADYPYSSGNSGQLRAHFAELARSLEVTGTDLVVDVGANDGTFLNNLDCLRVAVDPTDQVHRVQGAVAWQASFGPEVAREIVREFGHAKYVTAMNVLAHVDNPDEFLQGVEILLADDGFFITENHDLASIVEGGQWDTIYHEHLRYYSRYSAARLLEDHGLRIYSQEPIETHGGSVRTWASKNCRSVMLSIDPLDCNWRRLREDAKRAKWYLRSFISSANATGDRVAALGATARATTIISYCELTHEDIEAVYEVAGSDKIGRCIPGTKIPVVDESVLFGSDAPDCVVLLSWHLADLIVPKLRANGYRGEIAIPLPRFHLAGRAHDQVHA
jgi:hypothetical protein